MSAEVKADEVLVSGTAKHPVAGSGLQLDDRGVHEPKDATGTYGVAHG